ncbi:glycosyl hydrolase family 95 catalytic domain-containing protein [Mahella australiensis]|uniref:Alpha-L-fucosidase n=1 Tax=Mahella australiensis (strain DSM 15567 / CIP 107919 / 50-1 BON) TaxID=697281 RepID=F3ZVR1_MAHA5|nr:glycoside hydrolase N-terminal domain-containing protein [Mahella australiensis]AEE97455.1 Alpha-L-fucosidase [Mahella australiensis 50-1 BON]
MQDIKEGMMMCYPAIRWQDAIPCGNGSIGALVYGHIKNEIITLNHEALFLKSQKPQINSIYEYLSQLRKMLMEGKYNEGAQFFERKLKENYIGIARTDPYQPAFDIKIDSETHEAFTGYCRYLDFETGEAVVRWSEGNTNYHRDLFVSRVDDAVILRINAVGSEKVNCVISLVPCRVEGATGMGSGKDVKGDKLPFEWQASSEENWISFEAQYPDGNEFGGVARLIVNGGCMEGIEAQNNCIYIKDATEVLMMVKVFVNEKSKTTIENTKSQLEKMDVCYEALLSKHVYQHRELYKRVNIEFHEQREDKLAKQKFNEELLLESYNGQIPTALIQRMFYFGRYLLISSSRPGGLPANLQGIWNGDYVPAWASDYHNDENIEMNYWAALPGNLPETTLPYFDYYMSMLEDFRTNAKVIYGCRGILAPIAQTTHGLVYTDPIWATWTAGAGWLSQLFYDYWLFTGDMDFLKNKAIPFMKEIALFYEDFLVEGEDGKFMFIPSLSPENTPPIPNASLVTINATMDIAIAREVLANLCAACKYLGIEKENVKIWKHMLSKLPEYQVNEDGAIKEWIHSDLPDNYHHRHQSHIYPLFPGFEVTEETNPSLFHAMKVAVEKRLVVGLTSQTGWSLAHMANIYARLGDGDGAIQCLETMCRSCVGTNLFTYHNDWRSQGLTMFWGHGSQPPFQIDANFGLTAAIFEMLVFSSPGIIKLLPALPSKWIKGKAEGITCRGCIEVSVEWDMDKNELKASFLSKKMQEITVKFPKVPMYIKVCEDIETLKNNEIHSDACKILDSPYGAQYRLLELPVNRKLILTVEML